MYCIQHCFICRPSDSTCKDAGIEPRTVATLALTARRSHHSARPHPHHLTFIARFKIYIFYFFIFILVASFRSGSIPVQNTAKLYLPFVAEWLERLAVNAKVATVQGSIPASSDTVEYDGRNGGRRIKKKRGRRKNVRTKGRREVEHNWRKKLNIQ